MNNEVIGFFAGFFTTFSLFPQLYRVIRLRSAGEISLAFTLCLALGILLWMIYGIVSGLLPVVIWNAISLCFAAGLIVAKLRFDRPRRPPR